MASHQHHHYHPGPNYCLPHLKTAVIPNPALRSPISPTAPGESYPHTANSGPFLGLTQITSTACLWWAFQRLPGIHRAELYSLSELLSSYWSDSAPTLASLPLFAPPAPPLPHCPSSWRHSLISGPVHFGSTRVPLSQVREQPTP